MQRDPYQLLVRPDKTTITCPGGIALGFGTGPGLRHAIFWNRVGSLFSSWRPAVAVLDVFDARRPTQPAALRRRFSRWEPNLVTERYSAPGLKLEERRTALKAGLRCLLKLKSTAKTPREWVLFFHGQVEQWEFFDYGRGLEHPQINCRAVPRLRRIEITQPHPHHGLPGVSSHQTVTFSHELAACGFGLGEGDLHALWHDHGCLASLRMRLGQLGGRLAIEDEPAFSHRHPLYYAALKVTLEPGEMQLISVATQYHTDDEGGKLAGQYDGTAQDEWEQYLRDEVPQLECSDRALERYWYYVWYVLLANRTARGGHVKHRYTAPSKYMYWGPWIWDTYFHVLGEMWLQHRETAKDSIRAVLDMQFSGGYLPLCSGSQYRMCFHDDADGYTCPGGGGFASYVPPKLKGYREGDHPYEAAIRGMVGRVSVPVPVDKRGNDQDGHGDPSHRASQQFTHNEKTQTPLITVAAAEYCALHDDREFAREVLPALLSYDDWLWRRRTDAKGRFILWHGDESGWDDATRHYPVPAKPFDVQVHCLLHREALLSLMETARSAGGRRHRRAKEIEERARLTRKALSSYWDKNDHWHYDFGASGDGQRTSRRRRQIAAGGLFAMLVLDSPKVTEACLDALGHEKVFASEHPIPTLARCDPDYKPHGWGWNGPAWLQVNYFAIEALLRRGRYDEAFKLWEQTKKLIIRDGLPHSYELYDPETSTGMGCPDYSWQAMINHLVVARFAGVRPPLLGPALPPGLNRLALSNLAGPVSAITLRRRGGRVRISVEFSDAVHPELARLRPGRGSVPLLVTDGLGEAERVRGNGRDFIPAGEWWEPPPDADAARTWEIIVTCR